MYFLDDSPQQGPPGPGTLPYREALEETERKQREEYLRDCKGVNVLETLERKYISPGDKVRKLERKLELLPKIIDVHKKLNYIKTKLLLKSISEDELRAKLKEIQDILDATPDIAEFLFPKEYAVGSLESEKQKLICELSRARYEFLVWNRTKKLPGERRLVR